MSKVWTGAAWVEKPDKVWTGAAWVVKPVKVWTGAIWKTIGAAPPPTFATFKTGAGATTSTFGNSGTSIVLAKPTGLVDSTLLVAILYGRALSVPWGTAPAGWTRHDPTTDLTSVGIIRVYTKWVPVAASESATTYTWTGASSGRMCGIMGQVLGAQDAVDVKGAVATGVGPPDRIVLPSITTTVAKDLVLMVAGLNVTGGLLSGFSPPANGVALANVNTTTGASESQLFTFFDDNVNAGATGTQTLTGFANTIASSVGYQIAIKSA